MSSDHHGGGPDVEVITAREVPLGGPRAMLVRRTLPQARRSLIGAWCFVDHYGPEDVGVSGGMDVPPHPHTGLQTVSWLFDGEVEHRDSSGVHAFVRPGELNLMTAGQGICHSEVSTPATSLLHGVQLWVALPDHARHVERGFVHHVPPVVDVGGARVRVFLGSLAGQTSPVTTYTPLLGAEVVVEPETRLSLSIDPAFEHGVLVDAGPLLVQGAPLRATELGYVAPGAQSISLDNAGDHEARLLLLGGTPFDEEIVMWWNFVGRSHEEIEAFRSAWQGHDAQFGDVAGFDGPVLRLPAPELPHVRLRPRRTR